MQLRCWLFSHHLQLRCYLLLQIATTLLALLTSLATTLFSVIFRIATKLLALLTSLATTLLSSSSNCNYVVGSSNITYNYVVFCYLSNCNYVVSPSNITSNYVAIFFFKLQLRFWQWHYINLCTDMLKTTAKAVQHALLGRTVPISTGRHGKMTHRHSLCFLDLQNRKESFSTARNDQKKKRHGIATKKNQITLLRVIPTMSSIRFVTGKSSGILSDISSGIFIWHIFWHSIWHVFWHSTWHIFCNMFWHIFWHIF